MGVCHLLRGIPVGWIQLEDRERDARGKQTQSPVLVLCPHPHPISPQSHLSTPWGLMHALSAGQAHHPEPLHPKDRAL